MLQQKPKSRGRGEASDQELTYESFSSAQHDAVSNNEDEHDRAKDAGGTAVIAMPAEGTAYPSSTYREVDHAVDRSLLGSCFATLAFLIIAFIFFCPVFALLLPVVLVVAAVRSAICAATVSCSASLLSQADLRWLFTNVPILGVLRLEPGLDLGRIRDIINARVVAAEGKNGRRVYPRFSQRVTACSSGYVWSPDPMFRLDDHVVAAGQALCDAAALESYLNTLTHFPVDFERPLWEVHVSAGEFGDTRDTLVILRFHPTMTDGISLVRLFAAALSDEQSPVTLKARFGGRTLVMNVIRSLIILPIVFLQKWIFTRRDFNIFHPLAATPRRTNAPDMHFVNMSYPLAAVRRIKQVTRCGFNDLFVSAVTGAMRAYQQMCGVENPFDLLSLIPVDLTSKRASQQMRNNYVLVDLCLPGNTEGMIPRLWEVRLRMDELKSSADAVILRGLGWIFHVIMPSRYAARVLHYFCNKASCILANLEGPDHSLSIGSCEVKSVSSWFPLLDHVLVSLVFFTYGNQLSVSLCTDKAVVADPHVFLEAIFNQVSTTAVIDKAEATEMAAIVVEAVQFEKKEVFVANWTRNLTSPWHRITS